MRYVHHGDLAGSESRNLYSWQLLAAALDRTRARYGAYTLDVSPLVEERPNGTSLIAGEGGITVSVLTSRASFADKLIPVRIPIDRGLLGYRLLLIRDADQARFRGLAKSRDLRSVSFGALSSWTDAPIMRQAGLTVETGDSFDGLFKMLAAHRFDALSRGVGEIESDLADRRKNLPGLAIEQSLLLHYPMPVYFWFRNDAEGRKLAERVETGLRAMLADGSFDTMFHRKFDSQLARLDFAHRQVIELENPLLPPDEPLDDRSLWYEPQRKTD